MRRPVPCSIPFVPLNRIVSASRPALCNCVATERNATNAPAVRLYEQFGFKRIGVFSFYSKTRL